MCTTLRRVRSPCSLRMATICPTDRPRTGSPCEMASRVAGVTLAAPHKANGDDLYRP